jgi:hypothetical protein
MEEGDTTVNITHETLNIARLIKQIRKRDVHYSRDKYSGKFLRKVSNLEFPLI